MLSFLLPASYTNRVRRVYLFLRSLVGRRLIVLTIASALLLSLLDFFGFVLLFPFIKLATDQSFQQLVQGKLAGVIPALSGIEPRQFIALIGAGIIGYFVMRAVVYHWITRFQLNVSAQITAQSASRLIDAALNSRYQLFLDEGAVKIAGVGYSNATHASIVFLSVVSLINEATVILIILISFALISPVSIAVLTAVGMVFARFIFMPISRKAAVLGRTTHDYDLARHRFIHSMVSAVRDVKIMGLEETFAQRNSSIVKEHVGLLAEYQSIASVMRLLIEAIMMVGVVAACIWFVFSAANLEEIAPVMATLGLAVVRIAPAVSRLAANYNSVRFSFPVVEALVDMTETVARYPQLRSEQPVSYIGAYSAKDVSFGYGERQIIKGASLEIPQGQIVAIVGPSGSGKSTLLDLLAGLQEPASGEFQLGGKTFSPFRSSNFNQLIGYVPQSITLLDASFAYNVALEEPTDPKRLEAAIRQAHLEELVLALPSGLDTRLGEGGVGISGGQRQRIGIARALYRKPSLLILDEVTSALDSETAKGVMDDIHALKAEASILIVSHDLSAVQADRIYQVEDGRLIEL